MSHVTVQRTIVRMLYDPVFAALVQARPDEALASLDLTPEERRWLTAADPRAWRLDPMRRSRTLTALIEEYPIATAAALRSGTRIAALDGFFSSRAFHEAIDRRRSLALTFGPWLGQEQEAAADLARVEHAIAVARRAWPRPAPPPGHLRLGDHVAIADVAGGTLDRWATWRQHLGARGPSLIAAAVDPAIGPPPALPPGGDEREIVLVEPGADGEPVAGVLPAGLAALLAAASGDDGTPRDVLALRARQLGLDPVETREVLHDLVTEGLLVERARG